MNRKRAAVILLLLAPAFPGAGVGSLVSAAVTVVQSAVCPLGATVVGGTLGVSFLSLQSLPEVVNMRRPLPVSFSFGMNIDLTGAALRYRRAGEAVYQTAPLSPAPLAPSSLLSGLFQVPVEYLQNNAVLQYTVDVDFLAPDGSQQSFPFMASSLLRVADSAQAPLGPEGVRLEMEDGYPYDGEAFIDVPAGALAKKTTVTGRALDPGDVSLASSGQVAVLSFSLGTFSAFKKAVTVGLLYSDLDSDGIVDGTSVPEADLRPFWWDGLHWRPMGSGTVDADGNVVTFLSHQPGTFALLPSAGDAAASYRPMEMVSTPNGDGINDLVVFDGLPAGTRIVILDMRGRVVREFSGSNVWDGRDEDGRPVESGMYVYQLHSDRGVLSGPIAVAK